MSIERMSMVRPAPTIELYTEAVKQLAFLDASRTAVVEETFKTLEGLKKWPVCYMGDGFRILLLGRKGVGKTRFLTALQTAAVIFWPDLVTLYITYANASLAKLPSQLITTRLGDDYQTWLATFEEDNMTPLEQINQFLKQKKTIVFVAIDEFQSVYGQSCLIGKQIVDEVMEIACLWDPTIHCMITGSSSSLRELAVGKLPESKRIDFPNNTRIDLNSTKFQPRWIYPFIDPSDFKDFVYRTLYDMKKEVPANLAELLVSTGGIARIIESRLLDGSCRQAYSATKRILTKKPMI
jgi:hypothetical protein